LASLTDSPPLATQDEWASVLALAHAWDFSAVRALAIQKLTPITSAVDKIILAREHAVEEWLGDSYLAVCEAPMLPSPEDCRRLGMDDLIRVIGAWEAMHIPSDFIEVPELRLSTFRAIFGMEISCSADVEDEQHQAPDSEQALSVFNTELAAPRSPPPPPPFWPVQAPIAQEKKVNQIAPDTSKKGTNTLRGGSDLAKPAAEAAGEPVASMRAPEPATVMTRSAGAPSQTSTKPLASEAGLFASGGFGVTTPTASGTPGFGARASGTFGASPSGASGTSMFGSFGAPKPRATGAATSGAFGAPTSSSFGARVTSGPNAMFGAFGAPAAPATNALGGSPFGAPASRPFGPP
jgi:hypothetical protein